MGEMRNVFMALGLSALILIGYEQLYLGPKMDAAEAARKELQAAVQGAETVDVPIAGNGEDVTALGGDLPTSTAEPATRGIAVPQAGPRLAIVTPELEGSIALRGAIFDDLALTNHKVVLDGDEPVKLLRKQGRSDAYYAGFGWAGNGVAEGLLPGENTLWTASHDILTPAAPVTLSWSNDRGLTFEQVISVDAHFMFTITQRVVNASDAPITLSPYGLLRRRGTVTTEGLFILHEGPIGVIADELVEADYDDLADDPIREASKGGWMGMTDKYWMAVLIPSQDAILPRVQMRQATNGGLRHLVDYIEEPRTLAPGSSAESEARFFAGAKIVDQIDAYKAEYGITLFDLTIDWGWFWFLTQPIFWGIEGLFDLTGNFGFAIIIFTILLKAALFPLANRQYVSMAHMKKVQPKMKQLQERYKDDKQKLQQEMMALYQKEKINPLAGCLPLIPQVIVFFSLYKVLYVTIDMRHQPFIGWIKDLSAPDPLTPINLFGLIPFDPPSFLAVGILPILMGVAMWGQQKLSPTQMDPAQQKIMMFLPIIFTFILAQFSAGLVLYWTLNSVLSIAQQWVIMRREGA